jgi:hypothetical protein
VPPPERRGGPGRGAVREIFRGRESGYVFEHAIDGRWIARQPNGTIVADFEEVERTDEFVGLKSHNNFPHIKLFADHSEEFFPHESKPWKAVERGEWMQRR